MTRGTGRGKTPAAPRSVDVAQLAGVSQKTVSRVLNGERYVSEDVRRRVSEAAEQLGYRLNSAARALASGRTRTIGVVALGTALYGPASLLIGVERAARDAGYALSVVNTLEGDPGDVGGAVQSLLERGVDGIVVSEPIDEGAVPLASEVPVLVLGAPAGAGTPASAIAVGVDSEELARAATEHLLDLGHRTVHHLAGPRKWFAARDRQAGWRAALTAHDREQPAVVEGDWSAASGYEAGRELAARNDLTAVFAANDDMAVGLIRFLTEAGLRVPEDVSVVGFDDIPLAAYVLPPLTTVRQPFDGVAREGLRLLVHAIENPAAEPLAPRSQPVELVVRASTAPPASRRTPVEMRPASPNPDGEAHSPPAV
ncbi:LacI family DNA-binding transcriptional regulator [Streptomyces sp. NPDC029044]|uniref:LacI family DNA-binding transcriptional regulator n=1 Tax=Streptomyces sp. NPDC029044 TaxID=3157198 RepID=UPI0033E670CE